MKTQSKRLLLIYFIGALIILTLLFLPIMAKNKANNFAPTNTNWSTPPPTHFTTNTHISFPTNTIAQEETGGFTEEEQRYDQFLIEHHALYNQSMNTIGNLFVQAGDDNSLVKDESWRQTLIHHLDLMVSEAEIIENYENVPERFSSVQTWMIQLKPETITFSSLVLSAIEDNELSKYEAERITNSTIKLLNIALNAITEREVLLSTNEP